MAERRIVIPYAPRAAFVPYHGRSQRWAIGVAHRRCGKTVGAINDLIRRTITCPHENPRNAYVAPLFNQAKDVAWLYLKHYAKPILAKPPNESELYVELINGGRIRLYGADNPDRLRGIYLDHVVLDEYADMHPAVWGEVIRPLLADRQGGATFIGTPKGRNAFFEMYDRARGDDDWFTFMLRASETGILPQSELVAAARDMTPEQYAQEFECSFEAAILGAYYGKEMAEAERAGRITTVEQQDVPVHTAWDLGMNDATVIWVWQVVGDEIHVIDFYQNQGQPLSHYAAWINAKGYREATHWLPHDARARELGTGRSRVETLLSLGIKPRIVREHKIMDGINAARVIFSRIWFDRSTEQGLEALRQYRADYDDKLRTFKDHPLHNWASDPADGFRYLAMAYKELKPEPEPEAKPVLGVMDMTFDQALRQLEPRRSERV